jgi:hypothetical protein
VGLVETRDYISHNGSGVGEHVKNNLHTIKGQLDQSNSKTSRCSGKTPFPGRSKLEKTIIIRIAIHNKNISPKNTKCS